MSSLGNVKDVLGVVETAATLLDRTTKSNTGKKVAGAIGTAFGIHQNMKDTGGALTQFSGQTSIISRVFIEDAVTNEPVLANLMKYFHEWYAAQILSALSISQMVDGKRTVQDFMTVLQTGQNSRQRSVAGNILSRMGAQESFLSNYLGDENFESCMAVEALGGASYGSHIGNKISENKQADKKIQEEAAIGREYKNRNKFGGLKSITASENKIGPMGELFEVTLTNPNNKESSIKIPIYVQMQPSLIPIDLAPRFIDMNVEPARWQLMTMMRAGELSFWNAFISKKYLMDRRRAVVKDPRAAAAFNEFLTTVVKKDSYALGDVTDKSTNPKSANLANSVVIFTEETVARCKAESNIDLHNNSDRHRYFRDAYVMIIAVVDTIHQRVTIWFNGIDGQLDLSYQDFKPNSKDFEPNDFMTALQAFSTNQIGRLR